MRWLLDAAQVLARRYHPQEGVVAPDQPVCSIDVPPPCRIRIRQGVSYAYGLDDFQQRWFATCACLPDAAYLGDHPTWGGALDAARTHLTRRSG